MVKKGHEGIDVNSDISGGDAKRMIADAKAEKRFYFNAT